MTPDRRNFLMTGTAALAVFIAAAAPSASAGRRADGASPGQRTLSDGWRFQAGDQPGAEVPTFDDSGWTTVSVPHDYSIMDRPDGAPPFDATAEAGQDSGYLPGGIGWYRRDLSLTATEATKVIRLRFEAVYMDADIWVNGEHVLSHHYGYTEFTLDLTGKVRAGDNVIAVRVNHVDPSSRWYAGSGIIRPVTLDIRDQIHIDPDSVFVSTPVATPEAGKVVVEAVVQNHSGRRQNVEVVSRVVAPSGETVATATQTASVGPSPIKLAATFEVGSPDLWSPDTPLLYTLIQEVRVGREVVDERRTRFGIRTVTVDAENGLRINGQSVKLRGGNIHHDNYMLGAAGVPDADRRKVALMKAAGYNAIRNAHNPASRATLQAADELGMLVINEAFDSWNNPKRSMDYARFFAQDWQADIDSMVLAARNHPSVIFWSIGNEIPEQGNAQGAETGRRLIERVRALDPTRPVTQALSIDPPGSDGLSTQLDVVGYNYRHPIFASEHERFPGHVMYTSESLPMDAFASWQPVEAMPSVIGDFVWTAVDYLGESGIGWMGYSQDWQKLGPYPWHLAYCGEIDATGRKRPAAYYRQVLWRTGIDPVSVFVRQPKGTEDLPDRNYFEITPPHLDWSLDDVHPSWTWPGQEGKTQEVVVYAETPEVELFLNGGSLGRRAVSVDTQYKASFEVPYQPGRLVVVGYRGGQEVSRQELRTAGPPATARIAVDRTEIAADGQALSYLTIELFDVNGTPVYAGSDDRHVEVNVTGAGRLAGVGNGNPQDVASLQSGRRKTFHGRVVAVVQAGTTPGQIEVEVKIDGLATQRLSLQTVAGQT